MPPCSLLREGALPYSPRTLMRAAVKLEVTITTDRLVQLPEICRKVEPR